MKKRGNFATVACSSFLVLFVIMGLLFYFTHRPVKLKLGNEAAILGKFVDETLLPQYLPEMLVVEHKRVASGNLTGTNYTYSAGWTRDGTNFTAFLHYDPNLTRITDLEIFITPPWQTEPTEANSHELLIKYFEKVGVLSCEDSEDSYICEHLIPGKDKNQGTTVITSKEMNRSFIINCIYFKESEMYEWNSCVKRK